MSASCFFATRSSPPEINSAMIARMAKPTTGRRMCGSWFHSRNHVEIQAESTPTTNDHVTHLSSQPQCSR